MKPKRKKAELASLVNISTGNLSDLLSMRRNASYPVACKISEIIDCPPEIWLCGGPGTEELRRASVDAWREREPFSYVI